ISMTRHVCASYPRKRLPSTSSAVVGAMVFRSQNTKDAAAIAAKVGTKVWYTWAPVIVNPPSPNPAPPSSVAGGGIGSVRATAYTASMTAPGGRVGATKPAKVMVDGEVNGP